jgi:hypothetical protein
MPEIECIRCGRNNYLVNIGTIILLFPENSKNEWKQKRINVCEAHLREIATFLGLSTNKFLKLPRLSTKFNIDAGKQKQIDLDL